MNDALARKATVRELVAAFEVAERTVRTTFATLVEAEAKLNAVYCLTDASSRIRIDASGTYRDDFKSPDAAVEKMARAAWGRIIERFELRRFMSIARWEALAGHNGRIEKGTMPPITDEAVMGFLNDFLADAPDMLTEAVREVFDWLRPRIGTPGAKLKTNSVLEIGPRVIVIDVLDRRDYASEKFKIDYRDRQRFTALENVLTAFDGRGFINKGYQSAIETAVAEAPTSGPAFGRGETELFEFRCCDNRNLHLRFKRLDLLARFNAAAGGKNLRPAPPAPPAPPSVDEPAVVELIS